MRLTAVERTGGRRRGERSVNVVVVVGLRAAALPFIALYRLCTTAVAGPWARVAVAVLFAL